MSKFTPGPWIYNKNLGCKEIKGDKSGKHKQAQYNKEVACTPGLHNEEEDLANARLIAATPDLYEALMAVYTDIELQNVKGGCDELNFVVQQALAKVEGKEVMP